MTATVWDERLISREKALHLAGGKPIWADGVFWRCGIGGCCQSIGSFRNRDTSVDDILAAVVRHHVTAHGMILSGAS